MCKRNPNTKCDFCGKPCYIRPSQKKKYKNNYCSKGCYGQSKLRPLRKCVKCNTEYRPGRKSQKYCSIRCASSVKKPRHGGYSNGVNSKSEYRKTLLKEKFGFEVCMVDGCEYGRTFDLHRFVPEGEGGKYEIGNMFAICPNHHAEIHRGIIRVGKVSDCCLRILEG